MAYKTFVAGEEALAADVNTYLMSQAVARFATAAARTAAIPAPVLNQLSSLDTVPGVIQYWNGSVWADVGPFVQAAAGGPVPVDNNGIVTVTFPVPFAAPPVVVASFAAAGLTVPWHCNVSTVTATTALLRFYNEAGTPIGLGTNVGYTWMAYGLRV